MLNKRNQVRTYHSVKQFVDVCTSIIHFYYFRNQCVYINTNVANNKANNSIENDVINRFYFSQIIFTKTLKIKLRWKTIIFFTACINKCEILILF